MTDSSHNVHSSLHSLPNYSLSHRSLEGMLARSIIPFGQFEITAATDLFRVCGIEDIAGLRRYIAAKPGFSKQLANSLRVSVINDAALELCQAPSLEQFNALVYNFLAPNPASLTQAIAEKPFALQISSFGQRFNGIFEEASAGLEQIAALVFLAMRGETRMELHVRNTSKASRPLGILLHCHIHSDCTRVDIAARDITEEKQEHGRLAGEEVRDRALLERVSDMVCTIDKNGLVDYVSASVEAFLGWSAQEFLQGSRSKGLPQLYHDLRATLLADMETARHDPEFVSRYRRDMKFTAIAQDGHKVPLDLRFSLLQNNEGVHGVMISARDQSERLQLQSEYRLAAKVFENSADGILLLNPELVIVQVNDAISRITGFEEKRLLGKLPGETVLSSTGDDLITGDDPLSDATLSQFQLAGFWQGERQAVRSNGRVFEAFITITRVNDDQGLLQAYICMLRDITQAKASEERIRHLAFYDGLTDLPNRTLFGDRLEHEVQRCERNKHAAALLFLDLDGFKAINDSLGHGAGDQLLIQVAERLRRSVRGEDTVARMSGDEFTILIGAQQGADQVVLAASQVARKVLVRLNEPFQLDGHEVIISISIGVALYPNNGSTPAKLLRNADAAMYFAKQNGKNNVQFYANDMKTHSVAQLAFRNSLYHAVAGNEFEVFYQPIICYATGKIRSVESLLRWRKPNGELVEPDEFLPMAEQTGLVVRIGEWAIGRACQQYASWKHAGIKLDNISINLSLRQFMDDSLVYQLSRSITQNKLEPHELEIELAESTVMKDREASAERLLQLRSLGVSVAIDGFGAGSSSLYYLKDLPIYSIKIDRSIVQQLPGTQDDQQLIKIIVSQAAGFGLRLVAAGVETAEQSDYLAGLGCQYAQGFLFSQPVPANELEKYLRNANLPFAQILPQLSPAPTESLEQAELILAGEPSSWRGANKL